jgi:flavin-dependent dehydrogenase
MNNKRVAIIGSGPSGLISAKCAVENGLLPVVFEKKKLM